MVVKICRGLLIAALLIAFGPGAQTSSAQNEVSRYFPETGHTVSGDFLTAYESVKDPLRIYGLPITDAFRDPLSNQLVQYFDKARFYLDPTAIPELRVRLTRLGEMLYVDGNPSTGQSRTPGCRYFSETHHQVCFAFLQFFNKFGGVSQFGVPISDFEIMPSGRIVQYFQFARFEWHLELPAEDHVALGNLGQEYFKKHEDLRLSRPSLTDTAPRSILSLNVYGFTSKAALPLKGDVTIYIVVQDQNFQPVGNANVTVEIRLPGAEPESLFFEPTTEDGVTRQEYSYSSRSLGLVNLEIMADLDGLIGTTRTSFRIWK